MINFSGLSSGLDSSAIIQAMVGAQRVPITRLQTKVGGMETQISRLGELSGKLADFKKLAEDLKETGNVLAYTATIGDEDLFAATTDGAAPAGEYEVEVSQLARAEKDRSVGYASKFSAVKAGTLSITAAGEDQVDIEIEDGDTLRDVADKINASGVGADAAIMFDGTSYFLQITASEAGHAIGGAADDALVISESYTGSEGGELGLTQVTQAQNAVAVVDGLTIESRSNTLDTAIEGVSLTLKKAGTTNVTIASDREGTKAKLQEFVDKYNEIQDFVRKQTLTSDGARQVGSDSALIQLSSALRGAVSTPVSGTLGSVGALSQVGIKTDVSGKLSIDSKAFEAALDANPRDLAALFTTEEGGIGDRLVALAERYTDSDGVIAGRKKSIQGRIDSYDNQITRLEDRLDRMETSLQRRFTALESSMSSIQLQGNALAALMPATY